MTDKCFWCRTDDASDYHALDIFGRRLLLCEECFSISWQLMDRLSRIGRELGRRDARDASAEAREQR